MKKRLLAAVLTGMMVLGMLNGCGSAPASKDGEDAPAENTADDAGNDDAKDTADEGASDEKTDDGNGEEAAADTSFITEITPCGEKGDQIQTVAYIPMATSNTLFQAMADTVVAQLEAAGFEAEYTSPEFDPGAQLEIFENYVTQGFDCIIVFPINADSLSDAVKEAREAGIKVICQVNQAGECDGWVGSSGVDMGKGTCEVAAEWVEEKFADAEDGSVKTAVITYRTDDNNSAICDEMEKIEDYSSKIKVETVVEAAANSVEEGQKIAENLYMTNPDLNLVIVEEPDVSIGMNSYYAGADSPLDDKSAFGIFCNNGAESTYDLIEGSADDSDLLRGISSVAPVKYGCQMMTNIVIRLSNGEEGDVNFEADPVYLVTPDNIKGFRSIR